MYKIPLTQNQYALVDKEDFDSLNKHKWSASFSPHRKTFTAVRATKTEGKWTSVIMHREIMEAPKGMDVDHMNHNTLDNRKENLRVCTRAENSQNQLKSVTNTSGYKGVHWHKGYNSWVARIRKGSKRIHLGSSKDVVEAAKMYNKGALKYFGEFAYLHKI